MIKILVVDDDAHKIGKIKSVINCFPEISAESIDTQSDIVNARRSLSDKQYDLMILDLNLPERFGDDAQKHGGWDLIYEIKVSNKFYKPFHIIGLTGYQELREEYSDRFEDELWFLIEYEPDKTSWSNQLSNRIKYLIDSKKNLASSVRAKYDYDLGIVVALSTIEMDSLLRIEANWSKVELPDDSTVYHQGIFENGQKRLRIVAASAPQMGMIASSVLSTKLISRFRPRFIAIIGIAAGFRGVGNYGDILIADQTWDYGNGKISTEEDGQPVFLPDPKNIALDAKLKERFLEAQRERKYLESIKNGWPGPKPECELKIIVGPFASGSFVANHVTVLELIQSHSRKLIGIDMEAYGVFFAANNCCEPRPTPISIKSVADFGANKNNDYQHYAAYTSAQYLYNFAIDELILTS